MADSAAPDSGTATISPPADTASPAAAATAGSSSAPTVVTPVPKRAWGDEEDDDVVDAGDSSSAPSDYMESLKIREEKTLEEPEDSNITAVSLSLSLSSARASLISWEGFYEAKEMGCER